MSFEALMAQLHKEYVLELPVRIRDIESNLAGHQLQIVREDFHKLKGTGKTYGVPEISLLAAVMEEICITLPHEIELAVPQALTLLKEIHSVRLTSQCFDIDQDQRFASLKRLVS